MRLSSGAVVCVFTYAFPAMYRYAKLTPPAEGRT